ncbi:MAG: thiamine-phosphate kinase [Bernardetiaceae bacterium]|nr:thiamine-phosphate kinase [Bernardetiaceae bacterium]
MADEKRTELAQLGEFGLIDRLKAGATLRQASTQHGIGDDAAVIATGGPECLLVSTDMLCEHIHFDLSFHPLPHLGYKAVAVNVSDIAAMNATPTQLTVSLGLSNRFSVEAVDALYQGIHAACEAYNVDLVGGDTVSSRAGLVLSITALGRATPNRIAYRSGAKKGDILCVTGDLGAAYLGLQLLLREKAEFGANPQMQPQLEGHEYLLRRQLRPEARTDFVHELAELGVVPTAMIDISDGLASEVLHLCRQSGLGAALYEDKLPIDRLSYDVAISEFKLSPTTCALNGGEDYELLFTIGQTDYDKLKNHPDVSFIGFMQGANEGAVLLTTAGQKVPLQAQGWAHF